MNLSALAKPLLFVALTSLAIAVSACDGDSRASGVPQATSPTTATPVVSANPAGNAMAVQQFTFMPARLQVKSGTTVTWTNRDQILHTVTAGTPDARGTAFDGQLTDAGVTFSQRFDQAGTYAFSSSAAAAALLSPPLSAMPVALAAR